MSRSNRCHWYYWILWSCARIRWWWHHKVLWCNMMGVISLCWCRIVQWLLHGWNLFPQNKKNQKKTKRWKKGKNMKKLKNWKFFRFSNADDEKLRKKWKKVANCCWWNDDTYIHTHIQSIYSKIYSSLCTQALRLSILSIFICQLNFNIDYNDFCSSSSSSSTLYLHLFLSRLCPPFSASSLFLFPFVVFFMKCMHHTLANTRVSLITQTDFVLYNCTWFIYRSMKLCVCATIEREKTESAHTW